MAISSIIRSLPKLEEYHRSADAPLQQAHKDLAATVQAQLEDTLCHLALLAYRETGERRLCLAGGVALNCSANLRLVELDFVDEIFVQPAAHDAGTSVGAALLAAHEAGELSSNPMPHAYLGPRYHSSEIESCIRECGLYYSKSTDVIKDTVELLARGDVIGWFQGALEFGPRALGNRSILANPLQKDIHERVNIIKHRELWRPTAPAVRANEVQDFFDTNSSAPFMTLAFRVKPDRVHQYSAVVHADNTARAQTVTEADNYLFHQLLTEFGSVTGISMLINTSFNDIDMPIVRTPKDAIRAFFSTGLDHLVIDSFVVSKRY